MVRDIDSGETLVFCRGHTHHVAQAIFIDKGKSIVTGSRDGTVRIWNSKSGQQTAKLPTLGLLYGIAVTPDGKAIAQAGGIKNVMCCDISTGKKRFTFTYENRIYGVAFVRKGTRIAASTDGAVLLLDSLSGRLMKSLKCEKGGRLLYVSSAPNGEYFASPGSNHSIWLWSTGSKKVSPKRRASSE